MEVQDGAKKMGATDRCRSKWGSVTVNSLKADRLRHFLTSGLAVDLYFKHVATLPCEIFGTFYFARGTCGEVL